MDSTAALKKTKKQLHESGFKLTPQREATVLYYWKMKKIIYQQKKFTSW